MIQPILGRKETKMNSSERYILFVRNDENIGHLFLADRCHGSIVWRMDNNVYYPLGVGKPFKTEQFTHYISVYTVINPGPLSISWLYNLYIKIKEYQRISFLRQTNV